MTGIGHARNLAVAASGDAVIAVGGSYGTIAEMALALRLGRRVVALGWSAVGDGTPCRERAQPRPSSSRYETSARRRSRYSRLDRARRQLERSAIRRGGLVPLIEAAMEVGTRWRA